MQRLEGNLAVITGGSSGIARATPGKSCGEGANVAITGRGQKVLDKAVHSLGDGVLVVGSDVGKSGELNTCCSPRRYESRLDEQPTQTFSAGSACRIFQTQ